LITTIQLARTPKKFKPGAAQWNGGGGGLPRLRLPSRTHAEECQAEHSGKAERSGERGLGVSLGYGNSTRTNVEEGPAEHSGQTDRSTAEWGCSGVSPDYDCPTRTHNEES
jgi:hypothetical protein